MNGKSADRLKAIEAHIIDIRAQVCSHVAMLTALVPMLLEKHDPAEVQIFFAGARAIYAWPPSDDAIEMAMLTHTKRLADALESGYLELVGTKVPVTN